MLGTIAAGLLGGIAMPWKPKPHDILIANEMPPETIHIKAVPISPGHEFEFNGTRFIVTRHSVAHRQDHDWDDWLNADVGGRQYLELDLSAVSVGPITETWHV